MVISDEITGAIEEYILSALKNPTSSGPKAELVPELVAILERRPTPQASRDD